MVALRLRLTSQITKISPAWYNDLLFRPSKRHHSLPFTMTQFAAGLRAAPCRLSFKFVSTATPDDVPDCSSSFHLVPFLPVREREHSSALSRTPRAHRLLMINQFDVLIFRRPDFARPGSSLDSRCNALPSSLARPCGVMSCHGKYPRVQSRRTYNHTRELVGGGGKTAINITGNKQYKYPI
jgi:hypothetical protein